MRIRNIFDPRSGIRDGKIRFRDNIPDQQHCSEYHKRKNIQTIRHFRLTSTINDMTGCSEVCCEDFGLFAELEPLLVGGHQLQQGEVVHTLHLYQRQCLR
jgi:hypothetical protein